MRLYFVRRRETTDRKEGFSVSCFPPSDEVLHNSDEDLLCWSKCWIQIKYSHKCRGHWPPSPLPTFKILFHFFFTCMEVKRTGKKITLFCLDSFFFFPNQFIQTNKLFNIHIDAYKGYTMKLIKEKLCFTCYRNWKFW